jgi:hypothetical protein
VGVFERGRGVRDARGGIKGGKFLTIKEVFTSVRVNDDFNGNSTLSTSNQENQKSIHRISRIIIRRTSQQISSTRTNRTGRLIPIESRTQSTRFTIQHEIHPIPNNSHFPLSPPGFHLRCSITPPRPQHRRHSSLPLPRRSNPPSHLTARHPPRIASADQ